MSEKKLAAVKDAIEAIYPYYDPEGRYLFEKVKFAGKKFRHRKKAGDDYVYKDATKDCEIPLYNLPDVLKAHTVYIVEGEKDVDTLRNIFMVATCNYDGAGKWKEHYNQWLKHKEIVIIGDNDDPGRKHVQMLIKRLNGVVASIRHLDLAKHWPECPDHGDVTDYLATHTQDELLSIVETLRPLELEQTESKAPKIPRARYQDYVNLFETVLDSPRRDIFSDDLLFKNELGFWEKARGAIGIIKSEAATSEDNFILKYNRAIFEDHFDKFERSKAPELLIDVPKWDGVDRIKQFADCLVPSSSSMLNTEDFDQLISDWLCKAWQRVFDPNVRNRILVLKSPQNKGKDWWTDSLLIGVGQFMKDLSVVTGDKDSYLQLSSGMFLKVAEFEKTAKAEASILKDMITKPFTDLRAPHDRATKRRYSRCSFIGSANSDDLLRDSTGSSRFIIFEIDSIKFNYPVRSESAGLQILAQAKELARQGFKCSKETEEKLTGYLENRTPEDSGDMILECYENKVGNFLHQSNVTIEIYAKTHGFISNEYIRPLIKEIAEETQSTEWLVRTRLTSKGMKVIRKINGKTTKGYKIPDGLKMGSDGSDEPSETMVYDPELF